MTDPTMKVVPILSKFDSNLPIGELRIRADALPATPNFCFSLGIQALEAKYEPGVVPRSRYIGRYELGCVSIVDDESYFAYLNQVGVGKAQPATAARDLACWAIVMELRSEEGHTVTILPDNVDVNEQPNCAIECNGEWTGWEEKRFAANTLLEALQAAVTECRAWAPELPNPTTT